MKRRLNSCRPSPGLPIEQLAGRPGSIILLWRVCFGAKYSPRMCRLYYSLPWAQYRWGQGRTDRKKSESRLHQFHKVIAPPTAAAGRGVGRRPNARHVVCTRCFACKTFAQPPIAFRCPMFRMKYVRPAPIVFRCPSALALCDAF